MSDQPDKTEKPNDAATELAKERTHNAFERTLLAWIRTGLTLIGFGIGIFEVAQKTGGNTIFRSSRIVGLLMIILGLASMVMAMHENKVNHERLLNNDIKYNQRLSLGIKVGYGLIGIGILALINVIIKIIQL